MEGLPGIDSIVECCETVPGVKGGTAHSLTILVLFDASRQVGWLGKDEPQHQQGGAGSQHPATRCESRGPTGVPFDPFLLLTGQAEGLHQPRTSHTCPSIARATTPHVNSQLRLLRAE